MLVKYFDTIEELAKSKSLRNGNIDSFLKELLSSTGAVLKCSRINAWMFNEDESSLKCLLMYNVVENTYKSGMTLCKQDFPIYFKLVKKNRIIVSNDAVAELINKELIEPYLIPNNIKSMIDVPLRSEGQVIGLICFEQVKNERIWKKEEQKFTQSVAQLLSLALEAKKNREYREKLEGLVKQKDLLLSEINHRVKNNIAIIISLINLQKGKVKDTYHELLLDDIKNKVYSMAAVQEQLHQSENLDRISAVEYLHRLVHNLDQSFGHENEVELTWDLEPIFIDITRAIPLGLVANEIITNVYKYAFSQNINPKLQISCSKISNEVEFVFKDNGPGLPNLHKPGLGMEIVESLCEQIDVQIEYVSNNGLEVRLSFSSALTTD